MKRVAHIITLVLMVLAFITACQTAQPGRPTPTPTLAPPTSTPTVTPSPTPTHTPTPTSTPTTIPTPTVTPTSTVKARPQAGELFELVLTEQEVNDLTQKGLARQPDAPVSDVYVRLDPGQIIAGGKVLVGFLTLDVEVVAKVKIEDGKPVPEIVDVRVGGKPARGLLRAQLLNMMNPYLERWAQANLAVYVEEVQITRGQVRIVGRYK